MPKVKSYDQQYDDIRKLLKHALVEKGWTRKHLAEICGVTEAQISHVFNDPKHRQLDSVILVARKLGITAIPIVR